MSTDPVYAHGRSGWVAYQVVGEPSVDVVAIKPVFFPVDLMWEEPGLVRLVEGVGSFSRSIWFDPRGTGASDAIEHVEGRLIESWVDDTITVLDELGCERVSVLGFISQPALLFAAAHPERVEALVLVNPIARFRYAPDYPSGLADEVIDELLDRVRGAWGTGAFASNLVASRASADAFVRWCARCERLSMPPAEGSWRFRGSFELDFREVLAAIRVPTLVVSGPDRPQSQYVADKIAGARLVEVPAKDAFVLGADCLPILDAIEEFLTGALPRHAADRMLATVMFTDVVRSTETLAEAGDRQWRDLLASHDRLIRAELARFGGREIKATGDGFLATFDGPGRSIRCGTAIRDQVRSLGLEVRVGLHSGEIERHGDDITGIAVHIAQRIQGIAQPGEVLVSRTVVDLVAGSGLEFQARGSHDLKGVPGEWAVFATAF
jgi:class 3 adenylate cyclase